MTGKDLYYQILEKGYSQEELDHLLYQLISRQTSLTVSETDRQAEEERTDNDVVRIYPISVRKK